MFGQNDPRQKIKFVFECPNTNNAYQRLINVEFGMDKAEILKELEASLDFVMPIIDGFNKSVAAAEELKKEQAEKRAPKLEEAPAGHA